VHLRTLEFANTHDSGFEIKEAAWVSVRRVKYDIMFMWVDDIRYDLNMYGRRRQPRNSKSA
jgi:hypothetical protein